MKALLFLVLVVVLGVGLFLFTTLGVGAEPVRAVQQAAPGAPSLEERLAGLEQRLGEVVERLDALESRERLVAAAPATPPPSTRSPVGPEEKGVEDSLRELAAALENPGAAKSPELESLVVSVLEGREAKEEADRLELRRQAVEDDVNERMLELRQELGLDDRQAEDLRGLLVTQRTRRDEIFEKARDTGVFDRRTMRDEMRTIRDDFDSGVQLVLLPAQYERFQEIERSSFDFGPPRGPGGGPDGGFRGGRGGDGRGGGGAGTGGGDGGGSRRGN